MPELENLTPPPRKIMTLFLMVDTSGSMSGDKIQSVSSAIEEVKVQLGDISKSNDDAEIRIAVMTFSTQVNWLTPKPMAPEYVDVNNLSATGLTALGAACTELEKKLSRTEFLDTKAGAYPPVIILLSDGGPTDNFESGLNVLKKNNWFKRSIRVAFAIGADADRNILTQFTGSSETVIGVNDAVTLKQMLEKVAVITSVFQSKSKNSEETDDPTQSTIALVDQAVNETPTVDPGKVVVGDETVEFGDWGAW